jgi:aldehyde dehydrogenase (NAD+)
MEYPKRIYSKIGCGYLDQFPNGAIQKLNPATGDLLGEIFEGSPKEINKTIELAVDCAKLSLNSWEQTPVVKRGLILRKAANLMELEKEKIAKIICLETGKSFKDAIGETEAAIELGYFIAGEGRRFYGQTTTSAMDNRYAYTTRQPVGICALITSANTPIANVAWKAFPALLCGNTIILKPSEDTPYTATIFAEILSQAGLLTGVLSIVQGGEKTGKLLIRNPAINMISFTGSSR